MRDKNQTAAGYALITASSICSSFMPILAKYAFAAYSMDAMTLTLMRSYVTVPLFAAALIAVEGRRAFSIPGRELFIYAFLGIVCLGLTLLLAFHAIDRTGASLATIVIFTYPMMTVAMMAIFFNEPGSRKKTVSAIITLAGLALVLDVFGGAAAVPIDHSGVIYALTAALIIAVYYVVCEKTLKSAHPVRITAVSGIIMAVFFAVFFGRRPYPLDSGPWLAALGLGGVCAFAAMILFQYGFRILGAARTALISSLGPIFTVVWARIFLGEKLSLMQTAGMAATVAGIIFLEMNGRRKES